MAEINMVPLIDVVLVLLVIFIVTAPLLTNVVKLDLPKATSAADIQKPEKVEFAIDANGADTGTDQDGFDEMEFNPHGNAHTSFTGSSYIRSRGTAPRDPLFFLLHCNVDRLWARWQWFHNRFDGTQPNTFFFRGSATSTPHTDIGHNLLDTMWPWNNVTGFPRPDNAPRTPFPQVATATAPGPAPTVGDMIDYLGFLNAQSAMNFAYDDTTLADLARRVRLVLERSGGMFVKFGQIAATRTDLLPATITDELSKLHADVARVPRGELRVTGIRPGEKLHARCCAG
jgi:hypothetical protein